MDNKGKLFAPFTMRVIGAVIGSVGFILLAYRQPIIGTALIGIGSVLIAAGEKL